MKINPFKFALVLIAVLAVIGAISGKSLILFFDLTAGLPSEARGPIATLGMIVVGFVCIGMISKFETRINAFCAK